LTTDLIGAVISNWTGRWVFCCSTIARGQPVTVARVADAQLD